MEQLLDLLYTNHDSDWHTHADDALRTLFGSGNRYPESALKKDVQIRAPRLDSDGAPFAALISHAAPSSGAYGGTSFVIFPTEEGATCFGLVVGTQGLSPDEGILTRPGHARRTQAIARWLNRTRGSGEMVAWAKHDPVRIDQQLPQAVANWLGEPLMTTARRYGDVMYAIAKASPDRDTTQAALMALLDLFFSERGVEPLTAARRDSSAITGQYMSYVMPSLGQSQLADMLATRRFVVVEGPPGTGKDPHGHRTHRG
jgi:5-methylcytosine-specific restriction protein B